MIMKNVHKFSCQAGLRHAIPAGNTCIRARNAKTRTENRRLVLRVHRLDLRDDDYILKLALFSVKLFKVEIIS
jgi:hypothetical protein